MQRVGGQGMGGFRGSSGDGDQGSDLGPEYGQGRGHFGGCDLRRDTDSCGAEIVAVTKGRGRGGGRDREQGLGQDKAGAVVGAGLGDGVGTLLLSLAIPSA